jgi:hypothetical protein
MLLVRHDCRSCLLAPLRPSCRTAPTPAPRPLRAVRNSRSPSNVTGGREAHGRSRTGRRELKAAVDKLDTTDQAKFAEGLNGVAGQLDKVNAIGDDAIKKLQSGEIGEAMAKQPGCQRTSASASPTATSQ